MDTVFIEKIHKNNDLFFGDSECFYIKAKKINLEEFAWSNNGCRAVVPVYFLKKLPEGNFMMMIDKKYKKEDFDLSVCYKTI